MAACAGAETEVPSDGGGTGGTSGCVPSLEVCDGIDNNCDMQVDEGCLCIEGETQSCYSGEEAVRNVGACADGIQTCDASGSWGGCEGEVLPTEEVCDGQDNNCNTQTDEGFGSVTCGLGQCQVTVQECLDGVPQACIPAAPQPESCNMLDDDCDGDVDEDCACQNGSQQACYTGPANTQGQGTCSDGMQTCQNGSWGACVGDVTPSAEVCDGLDNDCNGVDDNGAPGSGQTCSTGLLGVCSAGITSCQNGSLGCTQLTMPSAEVCDGADNDCNGADDDGDPGGGANCSIGGQTGICADGTEHCSNGSITCTPDFPNAPVAELCNGLDDDCDGTPDDGDPEGGGSCMTGLLGACAAGTVHCVNAATTCQANTAAGTEICNNAVDEDCDGVLNNGCAGCGNGAVAAGEQCDDSNTANNDGCSNSCTIEAGYCCSGEPSSCIGSPVALTYGSLAVGIPDGSYDGTLASMGCVNLNSDICAGTITDMDVEVGIDHTWVGDLTIKIISPANTVTTLMHRPGHPSSTYGNGADMVSTTPIVFDDAAAVDADMVGNGLASGDVICQADNICDFSPNPDGEVGTNLAVFNGESVSGIWQVCVGDSDVGTVGTLQEVTLLPTFN